MPITYCNKILENNPNYNIVLYHKERILFYMKKFDESIICCDRILEKYPNNGDVIYDKSYNLVILSQINE
jgi:tetratricopeptide (TPR) repeat protein